MVLVDTNVIIDVWQRQPERWTWSVAQLRAQSLIHELTINPVIYAEISRTFETIETLDRELGTLQLSLHELPRAALFLAATLALVRASRSPRHHTTSSSR